MNEATLTNRKASRHALAMPALIAGLAVAVPLAAAAGPSVSQSWQRTAVAVTPADRAEQLIQYVSEAARQFCGSQPAVALAKPTPQRTLVRGRRGEVSPPSTRERPAEHVALPQLIALPPPTV